MGNGNQPNFCHATSIKLLLVQTRSDIVVLVGVWGGGILEYHNDAMMSLLVCTINDIAASVEYQITHTETHTFLHPLSNLSRSTGEWKVQRGRSPAIVGDAAIQCVLVTQHFSFLLYAYTHPKFTLHAPVITAII